MQTQTDPYPLGVPDAAEFLTEELARIRYQLAAIMGQALWYEDPATSMIGLGNQIGANLAAIGTHTADIATNVANIGANVANIAANLALVLTHAARHAVGGADVLPNNAINSAMIADGAIMNVDINNAAAIAWGKIAVDANVVYDNVAETIAAQWTFNQRLIAPGMQLAGNILITSTGGNVSITAPAGNIYLNPSGKTYVGDDLYMQTGSRVQLQNPAAALVGNISADNTPQVLISTNAAGQDLRLYAHLDVFVDAGTAFNVQVGGALQFGVSATQVVTFNDFLPNNCGALDLGSDDYRFDRLYVENATNVAACDVAEWLEGESGEPGDVYIIGTTGLLEKCQAANDPQVVGGYSTRPGLELGDVAHQGKLTQEEWRTFNALIGLSGSMPVKVCGDVHPGDYLITSEMTGKARAVRVTDTPPLFVIGRALEVSHGEVVKMLVNNQILYHNPKQEGVAA